VGILQSCASGLGYDLAAYGDFGSNTERACALSVAHRTGADGHRRRGDQGRELGRAELGGRFASSRTDAPVPTPELTCRARTPPPKAVVATFSEPPLLACRDQRALAG